MKIIYNHKKCVSCGLCVSTCPDIWSWGGDGKAYLKNSVKNEKDQYEYQVEYRPIFDAVVAHCPTGAIKLED